MQAVKTNNAPAPIGPYSQAIRLDNLIFCSGQTPLDPKTMQICSLDIVEQTKQTMENISAILKESGSDLSKIVKTTIYLKNFADFERMNKVYESYLGEIKPARTTVEVSRLPKDALVEIECIAMVNK
ncbi:MAG TPA: RidA family protein [Bacteroidia bacterium]|nr:RidA family protein [Bacteroidia bacterium]